MNICYPADMLHLPPIIARIQNLLDEGSDASVTYAALEARLALEKVCYDRLRQRHDYISHDQLRRWQPGAVVRTLMTDVDRHVTRTATLSIGKSPLGAGVRPDEEKEWAEVGTEIGFDADQIAKMWQALANLALHVRLPKNKNDHIPDYGDPDRIRAKVLEVVSELERLSKGTMTFSGIGEEVSFECDCGSKNRRRADLLREDQIVSCINPECAASWNVRIEGDNIGFQARLAHIKCEQCAKCNHIPWRLVSAMKYEETGSFSCNKCNHKNYFQWRLTQVRPQTSSS